MSSSSADFHLKLFLNFARKNTGKEFKSPRSQFSGRKRLNFRILKVDDDNKKLHVMFESGTPLILDFWRFEKAIYHLTYKSYLPLGARISENYSDYSLEGILKNEFKRRTGNTTDTKTAPHVADLLVLADIAELGYAKSQSGRDVQGVRLKS